MSSPVVTHLTAQELQNSAHPRSVSRLLLIDASSPCETRRSWEMPFCGVLNGARYCCYLHAHVGQAPAHDSSSRPLLQLSTPFSLERRTSPPCHPIALTLAIPGTGRRRVQEALQWFAKVNWCMPLLAQRTSYCSWSDYQSYGCLFLLLVGGADADADGPHAATRTKRGYVLHKRSSSRQRSR